MKGNSLADRIRSRHSGFRHAVEDVASQPSEPRRIDPPRRDQRDRDVDPLADSPYTRNADNDADIFQATVFETGEEDYPRMLLFGDSFRWSIARYLAEHFSRSVYLDTRFALLDEELIQHERPDLVIFATHGLFYVNAPTPKSLTERITIRYQIKDRQETSQQSTDSP